MYKYFILTKSAEPEYAEDDEYYSDDYQNYDECCRAAMSDDTREFILSYIRDIQIIYITDGKKYKTLLNKGSHKCFPPKFIKME